MRGNHSATLKKTKVLLATSSMLLPAVVLAQGGAARLAPVVVSGEKVERDLQETLSSVSVTTAEDISEHADQDLTDVMTRTPGVYTGAAGEFWGIRGVPLTGLGSGSSDVISVQVDNAYQPRGTLTFSPFQLWDVEQIEIYRGSQSTVQGRNALAGAVVVQTKDPKFKPEAAVRATVGNYGLRGGSGLVGGTLIPELLAGRLAVDYLESDGYIHNETLDNDANPTRFTTARGKLLLLPTDNLDVLLTVSHIDSRLGNNAVAQEGADPDDFKLFADVNAHDKIKQTAATAKANYSLGDQWLLTSITSNTHTNHDAVLDLDQQNTPVADRAFDRAFIDEKDNIFSQELRLGYDSKALRGHLSAFYSQVSNDVTKGLTDVEFNIDGETDIRNTALFTEWNWRFFSAWELIAGLRYDREHNETSSASTGGDTFDGDTTFDAWLPKLGLSYHFSEHQLLGFTVQRGYRAGGVDFNLTTLEAVPFDPEFTTNYELAYRSQWLDNRLRLDGNIYYTQWEDQQVTVLTDPTDEASAQVQNAAESRLQGVELSLQYALTDALELFAGASYSDTKYVDFVTDTQDLSGEPFELAPKYKFNVGANYRFANGLMLGAEVTHQDGSPSIYITDPDPASPTFKEVIDTRESDSFTVVDLQAQYTIGGLNLTAYVKNLLNEKYVTNNQLGPVLDVGAPRTFALAARYDF